MTKHYLLPGAVCGFLAVGLSAFGSHVLQGTLSERLLHIYQTAADFQMYHSLALVMVVCLSLNFPDSKVLHWCARFFLAGILLFSGSLYLLSFTGKHWLGAVTPLGGISLMMGWLMLIIFATKYTRNNATPSL